MMGPIEDECGVEQGGINSSDLYKVSNNEQLEIAQKSCLGVPLGPVTISAIGQADDVVLVSNDLHSLQGLLDLSLQYCKKYHAALSTSKTKLQVYSAKSSEMQAFLGKSTSILNISGQPVPFVEEAEHVGVVRSVSGNQSHLLSRFAALRKALFAILPVGLAKAHRSNPAASLIAFQIYCTPVLLSGIASLCLKSSDISLLDQHFKVNIQRLQKLRDKTPHCVVMFLGGQLPGTALVHLRSVSLFGMICRLPGSFIYKIAVHQLSTAKTTSGSWFLQIRELCLKYDLPTPLNLLQYPPTKERFKSLVRSKVIDHWETNLRTEAEMLRSSSLKYFKAEYMSLCHPHPIWTTCGSNSFEVNKAIVQAKMLSGRYVTDKLSRHWSHNKSGICCLPGCSGQETGSLEHLMLFCPALSTTRSSLLDLSLSVASESNLISDIILSAINEPSVEIRMQFLLDCSSIPAVQRLKQSSNHHFISRLFYLTRTWCYSIHRARMTKLGLFQYL